MKIALIAGLLALLLAVAGCSLFPQVQDTDDAGNKIYLTSKGEETTLPYEAADGTPTDAPKAEDGSLNKLTKPKMVPDADKADAAVDIAAQAVPFGLGGVVGAVGHFLVAAFLRKKKPAPASA